jgi:K(+)-stimulated pyrophosphate-energized sodium pump
VSELVVVLAVCVGSLLFAGAQARGLSSRGTGSHELERLLAAVRRACADFLWRETKLLALLLAIVGAALASAWAIWSTITPSAGPVSLAWSAGALCLGAVASTGVAQLAQWAARRATASSLEALRHHPDAAVAISFRGAAVGALVADAVSLLLTLSLFVSHYLYLTWLGQLEAGHAVFEACRSLPAAALGALAAALVFQVGGSGFQTAAGVAGTTARARYPHVARDEEQNPALVAELVGDYVGGVVWRSTDIFSSLVLANAGLLVVAGLIGRANAAASVGALALVGLPLVVRASGLLATAISFASFRFEGLPLRSLFAAGGTSHAVMLATGLFGAALWLLGAPLNLFYFGAGALGILASVLSTSLFWVSTRQSATATAAPDAGQRPETSVARALGLGLQHACSPLLIVGSCLGAAYLLGSRAPLAGGGAFALVIAVAAMLAAGAFNSCASLFAAIGESVGRIAALRRGQFDEAAQSGAEEIAQSARVIGNLGYTQCILSGAAAALFAGLMLPLVQTEGASIVGAQVSLAHPVVILGGVLGAGSLLFYIGGVLRTSSRAAGNVDQELQGRLEVEVSRGTPSSFGLPSYRDSVQLAMTSATETLLPLALIALLTPFAVGALLRLAYGAAGGAMTAHGLMAFGSIAALTGCVLALAAQGTLVALGGAQKGPNASSFGVANSAGEFMDHCVGPAALLGLKATVVSALAIVPFLF